MWVLQLSQVGCKYGARTSVYNIYYRNLYLVDFFWNMLNLVVQYL